MTKLSPEEFENVRILYSRAAELPRALREDFVKRASGYSEAERVETLSLLMDAPDAEDQHQDPLFAAADPILLGRATIPGYRILGTLGLGGMGTVYHAEVEGTNDEVAIKVLREGLRGRYPEARFRRECRALERLEHATIARFIDSGHAQVGDETRPYVVMELVDGVSLTRYLTRKAPSVDDRVRLLCEVADAIAYAHERGTIHRDLKPDNILVDDKGRAKVVDFGVAHFDPDVTQSTFHTVEGAIVGTFQYISPEQMQETEPHASMDIYSLGVVAYEFLTGTPPYVVTDLTFAELVATILKADPAWTGSDVPKDLRAILEVALAKDADKRYANMRDFADDLRRFLAGKAVRARAIRRAQIWRRRGRVAVVAVLAAATVFAAGVLIRRSATPSQTVQLSKACDRIDRLDHRRHLEPLESNEIEALIPEFEAAVSSLAAAPDQAATPQLRRYLWFRLGELHYFLASRSHSTDLFDEARSYWLRTRDAKYDSLAVESLASHDVLRTRLHVLTRHRAEMSLALVASALSFYEAPFRHTQEALTLRNNAWKRYARKFGLDRDLFVVDSPAGRHRGQLGLFLNEVGESEATRGYLSGDVESIDRGIALLARNFDDDYLKWTPDARESAALKPGRGAVSKGHHYRRQRGLSSRDRDGRYVGADHHALDQFAALYVAAAAARAVRSRVARRRTDVSGTGNDRFARSACHRVGRERRACAGGPGAKGRGPIVSGGGWRRYGRRAPSARRRARPGGRRGVVARGVGVSVC